MGSGMQRHRRIFTTQHLSRRFPGVQRRLTNENAAQRTRCAAIGFRDVTGWNLPDVASVVAHHLVSLFAIKGLGKVRAVLHRANHAELTRRVRINFSQQA